MIKCTKKNTAILTASVLVAGAAIAAFSPAFANSVATVNGVTIKKDVVDDLIAQIPAQQLEGKEEQIRKSIVDSLIDQELVKQEAERVKIEEDKVFVSEINRAKQQLAYNLLINRYLQSKITKEFLMQKYEENKGKFAKNAVKASHILVADEKTAKKVIKELEKGADFAEKAKEYSIGPTKTKGGSLGWFGEKDMVPEFATAAFALEKGAISKEPVKTQFGWHIIKVEDKDPALTPTFEAMAPALQNEFAKFFTREYLDNLKKVAKVEYK